MKALHQFIRAYALKMILLYNDSRYNKNNYYFMENNP